MRLAGRLHGLGDGIAPPQAQTATYMTGGAIYTLAPVPDTLLPPPIGYVIQARFYPNGQASYYFPSQGIYNIPAALSNAVSKLASDTGNNYDLYAKGLPVMYGPANFLVTVQPSYLKPAPAPNTSTIAPSVSAASSSAVPAAANLSPLPVGPQNYTSSQATYGGETQHVDLQALFAENQTAAASARAQYQMPSEIAEQSALDASKAPTAQSDNGLMKLALMAASLFLLG